MQVDSRLHSNLLFRENLSDTIIWQAYCAGGRHTAHLAFGSFRRWPPWEQLLLAALLRQQEGNYQEEEDAEEKLKLDVWKRNTSSQCLKNIQ